MEYTDFLVAIFRWLHIAAGLFFIGLSWWFNFIFLPFTLSTDGETRIKSMLELVSRALYWFRWSALYTGLLGTLLLAIVFYGGELTIEGQASWTAGSYIMVAVTFLSYRLYHVLAKSPMAKDIRVFGAVSIVFLALFIYCMVEYGHFSYRGYVIHAGVLFGVIMIGNVWEKIWPAQKKILVALRSGSIPDSAMIAQVAQFERHNAYLSVPLLWTMIGAHTAVPAANSWWYLVCAILVGWALVAFIFSRSGKLKA
jgi:uncharacterized membrane protein